jgi:3-oxoadipate enol-lactonase
MPYADVRGLEMYYEVQGDLPPVQGDGPRVLYISGTGGDLRQKPGVFDGPLPARFTVLAYDQRGLGRTRAPDEPCTMADFADDAAALLDALGWPRCAVMGVSFGGMVAQEFALRHRDRVERLVLACTSSGGAGGASYPLHELQELDADTRARRQVSLSDVRFDAAWQAANSERMERMLAQMAASAAVGAAEPWRESGSRRQFEARRTHDTYDRLPQLHLPVLVCGGVYDGIAPPENQQALVDRIPGARLEMFDGGHLFLLQDRRAWASIVEFLQHAG